jgi:hypothetical protein
MAYGHADLFIDASAKNPGVIISWPPSEALSAASVYLRYWIALAITAEISRRA